MSVELKNKYNYYHCENCKFKCKKRGGLTYFKGKNLCHYCKLKSSQYINIPTSTPSDSLLRKTILLKDIGIDNHHSVKKEKYKNYFKVTNELKDWAFGNKITPVGLTKDEHLILWRHFCSQGLSDNEIKENINKVKESIKTSHEEFKQGLREKPTFQEAFNKLTEVKK